MILLAALLIGPAVAQPPEAPPAAIDDGELVVTAPRRSLVPLAAPGDYFRRFCFDANRLTGAAARPGADEPDWQEIGPEGRRLLRIEDPDGAAWSLVDDARGHRLILISEHRRLPSGLAENRCALIVLGGEQAALPGTMTALFGGAGTERHIGLVRGMRRLPGWHHRVWTAIPQRGSTAWTEHRGAGPPNPGGNLVVVADTRLFYATRAFVLGDLKQSQGRASPVSIMSLAYTYRPGR